MPKNQSKRSVRIARDGIELGMLSESEVPELLAAGFLGKTDGYRLDGSPEWKPLNEWETEAGRHDEGQPWLKKATASIASATGALGAKAGAVTGKVTSFVTVKKTALAERIHRLLEDFLPEIRKLVAAQLIARPALAVRSAMRNDALMRKLFGAVWDCLPKPIRRFVPESGFIEFCLLNRRKLFDPETAAKITSQSSPQMRD